MGNFIKKVIKRIIVARQRQVNRQIAMMQLNTMSEKELNDIGITRGDIRRVIHEM